ncbi:bifunctional proline dehydrogenase/L-glutamate gamma-semialdehyde dehydrogenase PutA [Neiella marina]|uniref:Bifunctional protein PutA n=1 Tax=Neiella holothuriorum TaxID=2870530 RepID=A0ABS7EDB0_9GAMM|nr:bifunctional proline dehydrogenase/L-glutamate gamma-semialdehyde dehydrogenase PutA [Neiella holothuriorum]
MFPAKIAADSIQQHISAFFLQPENDVIKQLLALLPDDVQLAHSHSEQAAQLIEQVRQNNTGDGLDAFLQQYSLETHEGIILMCLAEALLRIPDPATADALIRDKLSTADWSQHLKSSDSFFVNASTWGLMLTGKVVASPAGLDDEPDKLFSKLVSKMGEPVIRKAMYAAMKIMGKQFVLGTTIKSALKAAKADRKEGYWHSFDMLGESALTALDAARYHNAYMAAIEQIAEHRGSGNPHSASISIKLSALHPRYEEPQAERVLSEMLDAMLVLINKGRELNVGITIDAEEMDRQELALRLFERLYHHPDVQGWGQLGLVVQTYSKVALPVLQWVNALAQEQGDEIPIRLVKGAYWDSEIKLSQQLGLPYYPVFTRKASTDVSYLACARYVLSEATKGNIYPQFATHNAHSVVSILSFAGERDFEFQRLHGMGEDLYALIKQNHNARCRIYAPVGDHKDLLPYLVRRLLENGANTSFVHKLLDPKVAPEALAAHPVLQLKEKASLANDQIVMPEALFSDRINSAGINLHMSCMREPFLAALEAWSNNEWQAGAVINGVTQLDTSSRPVNCPAQPQELVGQVHDADRNLTELAIAAAHAGFANWHKTPIEHRAVALEKLADLLEQHSDELIALCVREAGKTLQDSIDEVREAVDFCRYYAQQGRALFAKPQLMPGPTGESNTLSLEGRGVFACISPWNFPLAIFLGQISAALVAGNTVVAKPAEQTSLIAHRTVALMLEAGFPNEVIQLVPGPGAEVGQTLSEDERIAGVCFTGSTATAKRINLALANRAGAIVPLIAETGGQNAMIVDSTALPEQVAKDAVQSAFASAGQRCSALRVLYVQDDIAERVIELLQGAMAELRVGLPASYASDLGPVIDSAAQQKLLAHIEHISEHGKLLYQTPLPSKQSGYFVPPSLIEIDGIKQLTEEQFGPILHLVRYKASQLEQVIADINSTGFGLTLGIHSRNEGLAQRIAKQVRVGNVYINRNQIGAMVGVQPFGGQGLSGTGPKAGGPHYLQRFVTERTVTNNLTAIGGNANLLSLGDA